MSGQTRDELEQTVRDVVRAWLDGTTGARYTGEVARAVLAVPEIADALMAAQEARVYRTALELACSDGWSDDKSAMASYIETAETHLATLDPGDDSDIMPGSVKITITDPGSGEVLCEQVLDNDYAIICAGNRYVSGVNAHANGTAVITVKVNR